MKPETIFRINRVIPFLKTLPNTFYEPIQQKAIHGSADFHLCVQGRFIALELKSSERETPHGIQKYKLGEVQRAGGISLVANPQNWNDVKNILTHMSKSKETAWNYQN